MHIIYTGTIHIVSEPFQRKTVSTEKKRYHNPVLVRMDEVAPNTARESVESPFLDVVHHVGALHQERNQLNMFFFLLGHMRNILYRYRDVPKRRRLKRLKH